MGVTLGHDDRFVAQDVLEHIQIATTHNPVAREGVSKVVEVQIGHPCAYPGVAKSFLDGTQATSPGAGKNVRRMTMERLKNEGQA
jgi:hypothetical protein